MELIKSYKSSIILLSSVIIGGILGYIMGPKASVLQPFGDLFLNLMFTIIVPLVFFSVSSAIANMVSMKRLGKIMINTFVVFTLTALIASLIGIIGTLIVNPTEGIDITIIKQIMIQEENNVQLSEKVGIFKNIINTFTVSDFANLFSRKNMLQLIVFSIIFGISTIISKEKGKIVRDFLDSAADVMMKMVKIIMYYAPIGLGCYFASIIGQLGPNILEGYFRAFTLYLIISVVYYFGFFTLYAFVAGGKSGIKVFWRNALPPSITALATCSSAACIPVNLEYTIKMGVTEDISETVIPLGANIHKDGSVIGGVLKITFLFGLFGKEITSFKVIVGIVCVSYLVGAVMGAIPGGGMIGEMLILSLYGFPSEVLPIIAVISTIIDAPATLLNSSGNTVCAMIITRLVEGKKAFYNILNNQLETTNNKVYQEQ